MIFAAHLNILNVLLSMFFYPLSKRMKFSEIYFLRKTFRFSSFLRMLLYFHLLSMSRDRNIVVDSIFISALSNIKYVH